MLRTLYVPACSAGAVYAPESLVVFDDLGAGEGQLIAVSEGAEATMPFRPASVPIDAFNAAILDQIDFTPRTS